MSTAKPPSRLPATTGDPAVPSAGTTRTIRSRRSLPGGRAVVGGLLVTLAALGTWFAAAGGGAEEPGRYLVATRLIGPGERITADDVRLSALDLPDGLRPHVFESEAAAVGAVTLGPIGPDELVQAGSIARSADGPPGAELSFAVEADWAVAGRLEVGDRIDVFATDESAQPVTSTRVLRDVTIRALGADTDAFGDDREQTITVGVEDPAELEAAITATRTFPVTVVRVTDAAEGSGGP